MGTIAADDELRRDDLPLDRLLLRFAASDVPSAHATPREWTNVLERLLLLRRNERRPEKATSRSADAGEAVGVRLLLGKVAHSHFDSVRRDVVDQARVDLNRFGEDAALDDDGSLGMFLQRGVRI